jgi:PKD repeat protein
MCYGFSHNLLVGSTDKSSGGEVSQLQAILGVSQTGYFGAKTKQAVMNWQKEHDINPAGVVGPATRAALACGDTSATVSTTGTLSAAPTAGAAPLSVNFKFMTSGTVDYSGINFGDNTSITDMAGSGYCSPNACAVTHVYTKTGTYTAKLHDSKGAVISSKTITVGDGSGSPSATIDQSSLNANTGVLSGTATGLTQVYIDLLTYTPAKSACWTELHAPIAVSVVNNTWTYNLGVDAGVAAGTQVVILDSNAAGVVPHTLASGIYKSASAPAQNCTPGA